MRKACFTDIFGCHVFEINCHFYVSMRKGRRHQNSTAQDDRFLGFFLSTKRRLSNLPVQSYLEATLHTLIVVELQFLESSRPSNFAPVAPWLSK